jgi:hypothetical protein
MAFEGLKSKQSAMWGNGPYQNITETLTDLHDLVIDRLAPADGSNYRSDGEIDHDREWLFVYGTRR